MQRVKEGCKITINKEQQAALHKAFDEIIE